MQKVISNVELVDKVNRLMVDLGQISSKLELNSRCLKTFKTSTYDIGCIKDEVLKLTKEGKTDEINDRLTETINRAKEIENFFEKFDVELNKLEEVRMAASELFLTFLEYKKELETTNKLDKILELVSHKG